MAVIPQSFQVVWGSFERKQKKGESKRDGSHSWPFQFDVEFEAGSLGMRLDESFGPQGAITVVTGVTAGEQ